MSKYRAKKTEVDGILFDSKKEARRYEELSGMVRAGEIAGLILQPRFTLQPSFKKDGHTIRKIEYVADFMYTDRTGKTIVEDVKGMRTDVYRIKRKMFEYQYPDLTIREV